MSKTILNILNTNTNLAVVTYTLKDGSTTVVIRRRAKREYHGMTGTSLHNVWKEMKGRCLRPHHKDYRWYGAKGATVCDEWQDSFVAFYSWARENGYEEGLTIERKDTSIGYCPQNCEWISFEENRRRSVEARRLKKEKERQRQLEEVA